MSELNPSPRTCLDRFVVECRTILEYFGLPVPPDAQGVPLTQRMLHDQPARNNAALYGVHGGQVNVTDGQYVRESTCLCAQLADVGLEKRRQRRSTCAARARKRTSRCMSIR